MGLQIVAKSPRDHKVTRIKGFRDLQDDLTTQIRIQLKVYISLRVIRLNHKIFQSHVVRFHFTGAKWQI